MARVHATHSIQLLTGDSCPTKADDLWAYNVQRSNRALIVCREPPLFDVHQEASPNARKLLFLADPAVTSGGLTVSRNRFERWLTRPGVPWGLVQDIAIDRALLSSLWCGLLPTDTVGRGPTIRIVRDFSLGSKTHTAVVLQDRPGLASAVFFPVLKSEGTDGFPALEEDEYDAVRDESDDGAGDGSSDDEPGEPDGPAG